MSSFKAIEEQLKKVEEFFFAYPSGQGEAKYADTFWDGKKVFVTYYPLRLKGVSFDEGLEKIEKLARVCSLCGLNAPLERGQNPSETRLILKMDDASHAVDLLKHVAMCGVEETTKDALVAQFVAAKVLIDDVLGEGPDAKQVWASALKRAVRQASLTL